VITPPSPGPVVPSSDDGALAGIHCPGGAVVGSMDGGRADERPSGVVLAIDVAGAASRAATRVRKTKSLLLEPMRRDAATKESRSKGQIGDLVCSDR
jgi:hypothetical protein